LIYARFVFKAITKIGVNVRILKYVLFFSLPYNQLSALLRLHKMSFEIYQLDVKSNKKKPQQLARLTATGITNITIAIEGNVSVG